MRDEAVGALLCAHFLEWQAQFLKEGSVTRVASDAVPQRIDFNLGRTGIAPSVYERLPEQPPYKFRFLLYLCPDLCKAATRAPWFSVVVSTRPPSGSGIKVRHD